MKKIIFTMLFSAIHFTMFAQLSINANGNVTIGHYEDVDEPNLQVGNVYPSNNNNYKYGLFSGLSTAPSYDSAIGIGGQALLSGNTASSTYGVGVMGVAGNSSYGSYGVGGSLMGSNNGAAILGLVGTETLPTLSGRYAGYFSGPTVVSGDLTANNVYTMSDIRLKTNVVSLSDLQAEESPLNKLMNFNVIKYNFKNGSNKQHYGISAQELKELYPDMVDEGQEGYLAVNYIELIPILIRSVQELQQEINTLRELTSSNMTNNIQEVVALPIGGAILYQNSPNPFSAQTTIRFRIPETAQDSFIYIFDIQGNLKKQIGINSSQDSITLSAYELSAGIYFYSLVVNGKEVATKRMIISR